MKKNQFLYWRMENGHEHSFLSFETEDVLTEFAIENEKGVLTQEEYIEYVEEKEHTILEDIHIINFKELDVELAEKLLENDYIADFEVEDDGEPVIEFY